MTTRLTILDHIKGLSRGFINGNNFVPNRSRSYEVERPTSPTQRWSPQNPQSGVHTIKEEASVATRFLSSRAERFWSVNRGGGRDVEHTRSNLG
jgi:hypothetical protein